MKIIIIIKWEHLNGTTTKKSFIFYSLTYSLTLVFDGKQTDSKFLLFLQNSKKENSCLFLYIKWKERKR
jgi:hypothetical protein